jgi:hypothetical protein
MINPKGAKQSSARGLRVFKGARLDQFVTCFDPPEVCFSFVSTKQGGLGILARGVYAFRVSNWAMDNVVSEVWSTTHHSLGDDELFRCLRWCGYATEIKGNLPAVTINRLFTQVRSHGAHLLMIEPESGVRACLVSQRIDFQDHRELPCGAAE